MQKKSVYSLASIVLLIVLFVALNMLAGANLRGLRFDLTENKLYTLSEGTRNILSGLEEPVTLYLYFSEDASSDLPQIRSYARRVDELVEEFANQAGSRLIVNRIDPAPFSEDEDQAAAFGLQAVPVGVSGENLYLGIAGTNTLDDVQAMPFLQPSKEKFLEYDLAKMISSLGNPSRKRIGLISSLEMAGGFDPATQQMSEPWVIQEQLNQLFDVQTLDVAEPLPDDLDLLMLVHPSQLDDSALYRLEQYVLGGGRLVAFMDPFAEMDRGNPGDPMARMQMGSSSTLGSLLTAWGVEYDPNRVVGDLQYGIGTSRSRHIGILSVLADGINAEDIVSADLEVVNLSSTGWLQPAENAGTVFETLVSSSSNAAPMDSSRLRFLTDPSTLLEGFNPSGDQYTLAARVSGPAAASLEPPEGMESEHIEQAGESGINVILFADSDILTDRMWVQRQNFFGQSLASSFADNGSLVINAVDNLLGNADLISIRTRASSGRPFDRVEEIRVEAEMAYRSTEERLQAELQETERKLTELQAGKTEGDLMVISPEQQEEVQRFMDQRLAIRSELRQVQHDLQRDIESLGTRLKLINIALVPAIVMLVALGYAVRRRHKQEAS
jgi:ABC-type uncharacterized transport system involved in gliding motility auxiliary subunit